MTRAADLLTPPVDAPPIKDGYLQLPKMNLLPRQMDYYLTKHRFVICHAGRRTAKTTIGNKILVKRAALARQFNRFFLGGPTRSHAKALWWDRTMRLLKCMDLKWADKSDSELILRLTNGCEICVIGMDAPERFDGRERWDGGILDEYGDMDEKVWPEHIRPALTDTLGWCIFTGVPAGKNHYYRLDRDFGHNIEFAKDWVSYSWRTDEALPMYMDREVAAREIAQAKAEMDHVTYEQEYGGEFVTVGNRLYYDFGESTHVGTYPYMPKDPATNKPFDLCIFLDFNTAPGIAVMGQRHEVEKKQFNTHIVDEIWIQSESNTLRICNQIIAKYRDHPGKVLMYGDASGGARGTSSIEGSDWELVHQKLDNVFKSRIEYRVKRQNPPVRARVNSLNARFKTADGKVHLFVDSHCRHFIEDCEGTAADDNGEPRKDKVKDKWVTHMTDAVGYGEEYEFPVSGGAVTSTKKW